MNRISHCFSQLKANRRTALIPFFTCGDPAGTDPAELMTQLVLAGADIIELGMPFSDPMADGPVIQLASERALQNGMSVNGVLEVVRRFRATDSDTPVVLMGYLNPIVRFGQAEFCKQAAAAGIDGVLLVDMPVEEEPGFREQLRSSQIHPIMLVAPTTGDKRRARILQAAGGFVYYIRLKGVTGAAAGSAADIAADLKQLTGATELPVVTGFGIADAPSAVQLAPHAQGVVIGSALVSQIAQASDPLAAAREFLAPIRSALDHSSQSQA